jgi:VIT1/CCC1 family predicted Fe2+/Mn2+ transporter
VLFGLFMVLTFTGTLSVATAGREGVRTMLIAAIGCNTAWGFVDGVMYVLRNIVSRSRQATLARAVRDAASAEEGRRLVGDELGATFQNLGDEEVEHIRQWIVARPPAAPERSVAEHFKGAFAVFLLVFGSTFPVVLPFIFFTDLQLAMRVSAVIAISMMYYCGYMWGRYAGLAAWRSGLVMVVLGIAVEAVVIALGG